MWFYHSDNSLSLAMRLPLLVAAAILVLIPHTSKYIAPSLEITWFSCPDRT